MQTFLPYPDFSQCAKCLHDNHLKFQRILARNAILFLDGRGRMDNYLHLSVVLMWRGYEQALRDYYNKMVLEWEARGQLNTMPLYFVNEVKLPPWLGDPELHSAYRSVLYHKKPKWYAQFGWQEAKHAKKKIPYPVRIDWDVAGT